MASSSTTKAASKAGEMPAWRLTLNNFKDAELMGTQMNLKMTMGLLDEIIEDLQKPLPSSFDAEKHRILKLLSGLASISVYGFGADNALFLNPEKRTDIDFKITEMRNNLQLGLYFKAAVRAHPENRVLRSSGMPQTLAALLDGLNSCSLIADLVMTAQNAGEEKNSTDYKKVEDALAHVVAQLESLGGPSRSTDIWARLKDLNADSLLEEAGSKLTIDVLRIWSGALIHISKICGSLDDPNTSLKLIPAMDSFFLWVKELRESQSLVPQHVLHVANTLFHLLNRAIRLGQRVAVAAATPTPALQRQLVEKESAISKVMREILLAEIDASRAVDHGRLAWASFYYFQFLVCDNVNEARSYWQQSRRSLGLIKAWLPPLYCKSLQHEINQYKPLWTDLDARRAGEQGNAAPAPQRGTTTNSGGSRMPSVYSDCAFCGASGGEYPLQFCAQCQKVYYCSKECQKKDWKNHKKVCKETAGAK